MPGTTAPSVYWIPYGDNGKSQASDSQDFTYKMRKCMPTRTLGSRKDKIIDEKYLDVKQPKKKLTKYCHCCY